MRMCSLLLRRAGTGHRGIGARGRRSLAFARCSRLAKHADVASVRGLLPRPFREPYRRKLLLDRAYPHGWVRLRRGRSQRRYGAEDVKFTFPCPLRWEDLSESVSRYSRERLCDAFGTYARHDPLELSDIEDAASAPCRSVPATPSLGAGPSLDFTDAEMARYMNAYVDASGAS
jgi:hypothetical protein